MSITTIIQTASDYVLFAVCVFILLGSIFITVKMRFVQLRCFPLLFKMLKSFSSQKNTEESAHTISPHKALFTAMSTTLGIGTIVAPVIAISLGGPGALLGFLLTAFFGSAATFTEVSLTIKHRKKLESGAIMGGPMQYLKYLVSPAAAKWYAFCCLVLMMAWSGAQANQLSAILDSPLLGAYRVPTALSGGIVALLVLTILMGGIKRVGTFSSKIVPVMFILYVGSCLWILLNNVDKIGSVFSDMFHSALSPYQLATGTAIGGIVSALRWGVFKGIQTSEAGVGTQAIPHSMAETKDPTIQAMLAMLSTYTAGVVAFLSGCVALITRTWLNPDLPLGMSMVAASFNLYFSFFGVAIVAICTILFGFGTILGNSYNGSQCFGYLTENKKGHYYLFATATMIFVGAISEVKTIWSVVDIVLACMAVPHMAALILYAHRRKPAKDLLIEEG
jgi:alanine or glycine:cation symporter, AGCS family